MLLYKFYEIFQWKNLTNIGGFISNQEKKAFWDHSSGVMGQNIQCFIKGNMVTPSETKKQ